MEKSRGLGDTVAKITKFTGIKMIVDAGQSVSPARRPMQMLLAPTFVFPLS